MYKHKFRFRCIRAHTFIVVADSRHSHTVLVAVDLVDQVVAFVRTADDIPDSLEPVDTVLVAASVDTLVDGIHAVDTVREHRLVGLHTEVLVAVVDTIDQLVIDNQTAPDSMMNLVAPVVEAAAGAVAVAVEKDFVVMDVVVAVIVAVVAAAAVAAAAALVSYN